LLSSVNGRKSPHLRAPNGR